MMHDPALYHDPMAFKPDRFLEIDGRDPEIDPHTFVFGFGRRICPGRILADNTVWLSVAKSLSVFKINKPVGDGAEVDVKPEFQPGVISHPVPFRLQVTPRSAAHEKLILLVEQEHPWEQGDGSELQNVRC
jgi:cytochrome P450